MDLSDVRIFFEGMLFGAFVMLLFNTRRRRNNNSSVTNANINRENESVVNSCNKMKITPENSGVPNNQESITMKRRSNDTDALNKEEENKIKVPQIHEEEENSQPTEVLVSRIKLISMKKKYSEKYLHYFAMNLIGSNYFISPIKKDFFG